MHYSECIKVDGRWWLASRCQLALECIKVECIKVAVVKLPACLLASLPACVMRGA